MAFYSKKLERICDQRPSVGIQFRYTIPKKVRSSRMLSAHEKLCDHLSIAEQKMHSSKSFKKLVLEYLKQPTKSEKKFLDNISETHTTFITVANAMPISITPKGTEPAVSTIESYIAAFHDRYSPNWPENTKKDNAASRFSWELYFNLNEISTLSQLEESSIQNFINWRKHTRHASDPRSGDLSKKTLTKEVSYFKNVCEYATIKNKEFHQLGEFFKRLKFPSTKRTVNPYETTEMEQLLRFTRETNAKWAEHMILFLLNTGLRASEVDRMTRKDWHLEEDLLQIGNPERISGNTDGKTPNSDRYISITPTMRRLFAAGLIFEKPTPIKDRLGTFFRRKRSTGRKLPVKSPAIHRIRHTFASWVYRAKRIPLEELSDLLGHADQAFSRSRYVTRGIDRISMEKMREKHNQALDLYFNTYFDYYPI